MSEVVAGLDGILSGCGHHGQGRRASLSEKARDLNPTEPHGRYQLGLAYLQAGRPRDAIPELSKPLELSPDLSLAHMQLALAHLSLGMRREAAAEADLAARVRLPLPAELHMLRG